MTPAVLTIVLALLSRSTVEKITLLEPSWASGEISVDARLLVMAEISPAESLENVWLELRSHGRDWEREAIPSSKQIRFPPKTVVAVAVEPRRMPRLQAGGEFELRLRAGYRKGEIRSSETILIRLADPDRRELALLEQLTACRRHLESMLDGLEEDHRKLSKVEWSSNAETLDPAGLLQLEAMELRGQGRRGGILRASDDLLSILEGAVTDRLVNPAREARYRKLVARLRAFGLERGPEENLVRARRANSREALLAVLDAEDRFIERFQRSIAEVEGWRGSLELRREVRSLLQSQKTLNGELERERDREK